MDDLLTDCTERILETDQITDSQKVELLKAFHTINKYIDLFNEDSNI